MNPDDHILDYADAYLHQALSPDEARAVERHAKTCRICQTALEEARRRFDAMQSLPPVEASERLVQQTIDRIERYRPPLRLKMKRWTFATVLAATAASVLAIAGLHLYYYTLRPPVYDLRILGQSELLAGAPASLRVGVFDTRQNRFVSGVPVQVALYKPSGGERVDLAQFTTGESEPQKTVFRLPPWPDGSYELRVSAKLADGKPDELLRSVQLKRSWRLMLSSDKPVYQPGQTIHLRSLALQKPDLMPVAGQEAVFTIADPKGNVIFKQTDPTGKFGIASADCPLASEVLEGEYQIECRVGDTTSRRTVKVERYVLPKFKLDVTLDKPFYLPGEQVKGEVQVDYFFGKPVAGATLKLYATAPDIGWREIAALDAKANDAGKAEFRFSLPASMIGQPQNEGDARFRLIIEATDSAGQSHTRSVSRRVAAQPIHVEVIPESPTLLFGQTNRIYVFTQYPDGRPAATRLSITGVTQEIATNDLGVAVVEVIPQAPQLDLTLRATDAQGQIGRRSVRLGASDAPDDFILRPDRAVYDGGQTMTLTALGHGIEPVFVDLLKDGQTMLTTTLAMQNGRGEEAIDLPPDVFGTLRLVAYRFDANGLSVRQERTIYVRQSKQLQLDVTMDRETYQPGQSAALRFRLTDGQGHPAPGALSLAAVDEAVFAVLTNQEPLEETFFTLEQELLQPVYTIYDWDPHTSRQTEPTERRLLEEAIFAATARSERYATPGDGYSLFVRSYPEKLQAFEARRYDGLAWAKMAWIVWGMCVAGLGALALTIQYPRKMLIVYGIVGLPSLCVLLLLPATQAAREAARRAGLVNDLAATAMAMPMAMESASDAAIPTSGAEGGPAPPRVREFFPETLLWRPELVTDDNGEATLALDLADSITTWRLSASAVTGEGRLGGGQWPLRVFQPFFVDLNLPVALTRGDEASVPLVVYNYLDQPQTVKLTLKDADWFERLDENTGEWNLELQPSEVRAIRVPLRVNKVGWQELEVTAIAGEAADAIRRRIEVVPGGQRVEESFSGRLTENTEMTFNLPQEAIEGSAKLLVKIHPSTFSQLAEGLDAIFQMPYGCFEQTSSTTYPNVLALDYLRRMNIAAPEVEAKARQYIHLGYQRLVSFEVPGGGFDWFGRPPANAVLTAYGLMEFEDMARVHNVDPNLIDRTRRWLLTQRQANGAWPADRHGINDGLIGSTQRGDAELATTAYLGWAVFRGGQARSEAAATVDYLLAHEPATINDPYLLAIVANALLEIDPNNRAAVNPYLEKLESLKQTDAGGQTAWWQMPEASRTMFYGAGRSGDVEATSLAALAFLKRGDKPALVRQALTWIVAQKSPGGTWYSTQATVLALKALIEGAAAPLGGDEARQIEIALNGNPVQTVVIPADQAEVMKQLDLSRLLEPGVQRVALRELTQTGAGYQVTFAYHVEGELHQMPTTPPALAIDLAYDRTRLAVNETVTAVATVANHRDQAAPMVIVDLPIPGGFTLEPGELDELVGDGTIARYQLTPRQAIVYLRALAPGEKLELRYRLRAAMPVKVQVPAAEVYEYYNPETRAKGGAVAFEALET